MQDDRKRHARREDPETSKDAAKAMPLGRLEARVVRTLRDWPNGLTTTEIAALMQEDRDSISPRMKKLAQSGLVQDTGRARVPKGKRVKSTVWALA